MCKCRKYKRYSMLFKYFQLDKRRDDSTSRQVDRWSQTNTVHFATHCITSLYKIIILLFLHKIFDLRISNNEKIPIFSTPIPSMMRLLQTKNMNPLKQSNIISEWFLQTFRQRTGTFRNPLVMLSRQNNTAIC